MPFFNTNEIEPIEPLPGWKGRYFNSESMTFGFYDVAAGASIHEHHHDSEEVLMVVDGEIEITIDGETQIVGPQSVAVVPSNAPHSLKVIADARLIAADHPIRMTIGGKTLPS